MHYRSISKFQYWTAFKSEVEKYQRKPISFVSDLKCGKMKIESIRILPPVCLKIKTNSNAQKYYRRLALFETSQLHHIASIINYHNLSIRLYVPYIVNLKSPAYLTGNKSIDQFRHFLNYNRLISYCYILEPTSIEP